MDDINLSIFSMLVEHYDEILFSIKSNYYTDWDDSIHSSFRHYIHKLESYQNELDEIRLDIRKLENNIEELNLNDVYDKADTLCDKVDSL